MGKIISYRNGFNRTKVCANWAVAGHVWCSEFSCQSTSTCSEGEQDTSCQGVTSSTILRLEFPPRSHSRYLQSTYLQSTYLRISLSTYLHVYISTYLRLPPLTSQIICAMATDISLLCGVWTPPVGGEKMKTKILI